MSKSKGEITKTALDENSINTIKEKDKTLSTILSIGIPILIFVPIIIDVGTGVLTWGRR